MWMTEWWGADTIMPWMAFAPLMMVAFFVFVGLLVYLAAGLAKRRGRALEILEERFARGEIDQAEFEARRRVIGA